MRQQQSPDGFTIIYMITYVMCNRKDILVDCGVVTRVDMGSDVSHFYLYSIEKKESQTDLFVQISNGLTPATNIDIEKIRIKHR